MVESVNQILFPQSGRRGGRSGSEKLIKSPGDLLRQVTGRVDKEQQDDQYVEIANMVSAFEAS